MGELISGESAELGEMVTDGRKGLFSRGASQSLRLAAVGIANPMLRDLPVFASGALANGVVVDLENAGNFAQANVARFAAAADYAPINASGGASGHER